MDSMANDTRKAKVILEVEEKGAKEASNAIEGIGKGATSLQKELGRLSRVADLDNLGREFGQLARETGDVGKAVADLTEKLEGLGATQGEIQGVARAFHDAQSGSAGGLGGSGNAPAAAKFRGVAGLVGGEAASNVVGVIDDVQDAFEGLSAAASAAPGALSAAASALGPVGLGLAAVAAVAAAAFIAASQDIQKEAQKIDEISKSRLSLSQRLPDLTQGEATAELERNAEVRQNLLRDVQRAEQEYNKFLEGHTDLEQDLLRVGDAREDALAKAVDDAKKALQSLETDSETLQEALDEGRVKADEVTQAEQKLAETRTTETKKAIDDTAKAEQERARAAEKAAAEAQQQAEKTAQAQEKYASSIKNIGRQFKEATADIGTKRKQGEFDIRIGLGRDLDDIFLKNTQDITKLIKDDWRSARDEAFKNADEINDIRDEGRKSELEAIREGDFKQLFLSREATKDRLAQEAKTDQREQQLRERHLADAKDDLQTSLKQEQDIRRTAAVRSLADLNLNADRELAQARTAKQRSLAMAAEAYNAELKQFGAYLQARQQLQGQMLQAGNKTTSTGATLLAGQFAASLQPIFAK
jgi:hypothetical protein